MSHDPTRRSNLDTMSPAERAIHDAMLVVEKMPADERLTRAVMFLERAKEAVADYVDRVDFLQRFVEHQASRDHDKEWADYVASTALHLVDADGKTVQEYPLVVVDNWTREGAYMIAWRGRHYRVTAIVPRGIVEGATHGFANEIVAHEIDERDPLRDYERDEPPFALADRPLADVVARRDQER